MRHTLSLSSSQDALNYVFSANGEVVLTSNGAMGNVYLAYNNNNNNNGNNNNENNNNNSNDHQSLMMFNEDATEKKPKSAKKKVRADHSWM